MLLKCCTEYASKFGKFSNGHRTGKCLFSFQSQESEGLLLNYKTSGFLASGGDIFNLGPEMRLNHSELLCSKVLLKYKGDRESF